MSTRFVRRCALAILAAAIFEPAWDGGFANAQSDRPWLGEEERTQLVARLRTALPAGWTVTPGPAGRVPDQWHSLDARTFEIEGRSGRETFRVWFVPADWIGIRQPDPYRTREVYWEGVLMDQRYKAIVPADQYPPFERLDDVPIYKALRAMGMNQPSLVNSGWTPATRLFGNRLAEVDRQTQDLVHEYCIAQECVDEAAYSLIILGVPAWTLTLRCAEHGSGVSQAYCADALGYWKGPASVRVLNAVISDPSTPAKPRRHAAFSLGRIADRSSGPALGRALKATDLSDRDTALSIVDALARLRYQPAAPDILARLEAESERWAQMFYVRALAALRYAPAIPAIEKLCETTTVSADWLIEKGRGDDGHSLPELALLRIAAPWGDPGGGLRILLVAPQNPMLPGPIKVAAVIEHVGDADMEDMKHRGGVWIVDGKEYPNIDQVKYDGTMILRVNDTNIRAVDLSGPLATPGVHLIQYRLFGATSNQLSLVVR